MWVSHEDQLASTDPEKLAALIQEALQLERRLKPFGPLRWCLDVWVPSLHGFSLEATYKEYINIRVTPKGTYVTNFAHKFADGRRAGFLPYDYITVSTEFSGPNAYGAVVQARGQFIGEASIADAAKYIHELVFAVGDEMDGYYEVRLPEEAVDVP